MICIIDYKTGNLGSIRKMLTKLGYEVEISSEPSVITESDKLILPGVGSFDKGISNLQELDLINLLNKEVILKKKPILGICLGMQLMAMRSDEGEMEGLGWVDATVKRFPKRNTIKVPHMGWNYGLYPEREAFKAVDRFYFVHSYYVETNRNEDVLMTTDYANFKFTSAFKVNNIVGIQAHPEKSHKYGMKFLQNYLNNEYTESYTNSIAE